MPTELAPIERRPARQVVFEQLRQWIERGDFVGGEAIKDAEVAAALGVSRTPVREALQMLEQHGLVEMLPGRLTRVTETTPQDIALVYAPLSALQALAAELGTPEATTLDIDEMVGHNERLFAAISAPDPIGARDCDRAFHGVLLGLAKNPYLTSAAEPLLMHVRRLEARYFREAALGRQSYDEHRLIISAVRAGDAISARETTRRNFQRYWLAEEHDSNPTTVSSTEVRP